MNLTIISASARESNRTIAVSHAYAEVAAHLGMEPRILDLRSFEVEMLARMAQGKRKADDPGENDDPLGSGPIVFIVPEYNGSFPGMLKLFIDAMPQRLWKGRTAGLVGISAGRSGNLRGLDHLTGVLNYLDVLVLPNRINIDRVNQWMPDGRFESEEYNERFQKQLVLLKENFSR